MSWERVYPFRSTTINQYQTPVALIEKDSILWFKHDKSYCKRCVVWGWGVCSLALRKCSRNSLYFPLYRFTMNRFQLTPLTVAITTSTDWYIDFPKTFYFSLWLCPSYLLWLRNKQPSEASLIVTSQGNILNHSLGITIFTFSNHLQFITCNL